MRKGSNISSWRANTVLLIVVIFAALVSMLASITSATTTTADSQLQEPNALKENGLAIYGAAGMGTDHGQISTESFLGCVTAVPSIAVSCVGCFAAMLSNIIDGYWINPEALKPYRACCDDILNAGEECFAAHFQKYGDKLYNACRNAFPQDGP